MPLRRITRLVAPVALVAALALAAEPALAIGGQEPGEESSGVFTADNGFRPETWGYSFANYSSGATDLTAAELVRFFGAQVCVNGDAANCVLTPQAEQWRVETNNSMGGGHCEGMAATSVLFYTGLLDPNALGAPTVNALPFNELVQREIAYWWATQVLEPTSSASREQLLPSQVVDRLFPSLQGGARPAESYTLWFFNREQTAGHAVTPIALEDRGNGVNWIIVYDNNWPNELRAVEVDRNNETWNYDLGTSASNTGPAELWEGDAGTFTLGLGPTSARTQPQQCPFCAEQPQPAPEPGPEPQPEPTPAPEPEPTPQPTLPEPAPLLPLSPVYVNAPAGVGVVLTDDRGRPAGIAADGTAYSDSPDIQVAPLRYAPPKGFPPEAPPVFWVPADDEVTVTLDSGGVRTGGSASVSVTRFGPGTFASVSGIKMKRGERDAVTLAAGAEGIGYRTSKARRPVFRFGYENTEGGWSFQASGIKTSNSGGRAAASLDAADGAVVIDAGKGARSSEVTLDASFVDRSGDTEEFGAADADIKASRRATYDFAAVAAGDEPALDVSKLSGKNPKLSVPTNKPFVDRSARPKG